MVRYVSCDIVCGRQNSHLICEGGAVDYLIQQEIPEFIGKLEKYGYPQVAIINLLQSLGVNTDKYNVGTNGEVSNMPRELADAILNYASIASRIKVEWKSGINPHDLMAVLPDRNAGRVTKKMALDALKIVVGGHVSQIVKKLENELGLGGTQDTGGVRAGMDCGLRKIIVSAVKMHAEKNLSSLPSDAEYVISTPHDGRFWVDIVSAQYYMEDGDTSGRYEPPSGDPVFEQYVLVPRSWVDQLKK